MKAAPRTRREWAVSDLEYLVDHFADKPTRVVAEALGRATTVVSQKAYAMGLRKSPAYLSSPAAGRLQSGDTRGGATRFAPGHESWNKGQSMPSVGRTAETQFKKGQLSGRAAQIAKPVGAERVSKDGYLERKVNNDLPLQKRWRAVHILVWEAANGPLPPGHAIAFLPGRRTAEAERITLDALELVSRAELMRRNSHHTNYPKEVSQLIQLKGALQRKINRRTAS